jgi:hypothetical protein
MRLMLVTCCCDQHLILDLDSVASMLILAPACQRRLKDVVVPQIHLLVS